VAETAPFLDHELELLDRCAVDEGVTPTLLRALMAEQARTRADGRSGLRSAIEGLVDAAAMDIVTAEDCSRAD
jgi:hypothetical protein